MLTYYLGIQAHLYIIYIISFYSSHISLSFANNIYYLSGFYTFITLFSLSCPTILTCDSKTPLINSENSGHSYFVPDFHRDVLKFPTKPKMVFGLRWTYLILLRIFSYSILRGF